MAELPSKSKSSSNPARKHERQDIILLLRKNNAISKEEVERIRAQHFERASIGLYVIIALVVLALAVYAVIASLDSAKTHTNQDKIQVWEYSHADTRGNESESIDLIIGFFKKRYLFRYSDAYGLYSPQSKNMSEYVSDTAVQRILKSVHEYGDYADLVLTDEKSGEVFLIITYVKPSEAKAQEIIYKQSEQQPPKGQPAAPAFDFQQFALLLFIQITFPQLHFLLPPRTNRSM